MALKYAGPGLVKHRPWPYERSDSDTKLVLLFKEGLKDERGPPLPRGSQTQPR